MGLLQEAFCGEGEGFDSCKCGGGGKEYNDLNDQLEPNGFTAIFETGLNQLSWVH